MRDPRNLGKAFFPISVQEGGPKGRATAGGHTRLQSVPEGGCEASVGERARPTDHYGAAHFLDVGRSHELCSGSGQLVLSTYSTPSYSFRMTTSL